MESSEDRQQLEITALKSIYDENFLECPPPKAWKGAPRLPEFIIRVRHRDEENASKIYFHLHIKFPKTYPTLATPIFTVQQPILGLKPHHIAKISSIVHAEAQKLKGTEAVFQVVEAAQDWLENNVTPPVEPIGSLATEMIRRALEEEQAKRQREEAEAEEQHEREARRALELEEQIRADAERQQQERERLFQARKRAFSDATEVPEAGEDTTPTETFSEKIEWQGVTFSKVRLFHPQKECLGTVWQAEPVSEDARTAIRLELLVVSFDSRYYSTTQGRKKLKSLESEIRRLTSIRHANLLAVLAVRLILPNNSDFPRLLVLCERRPAVTLRDMLDDCDSLREDRASDYLTQILSALNAIHSVDVVHRGLALQFVGLEAGDRPGESKRVKLFKVGYHVRLVDMNRSEPFCASQDGKWEDRYVSEGWLPKDAVESPLVYTRGRDLHCAGVILLQMLLGWNVMDQYSDIHSALTSAPMSASMQLHALNMLVPTKRNVTAHSLLADMAGIAFGNALRSPAIAINGAGPKTPTLQGISSSPESDYFRGPPPSARSHVSRWKEDWEELELLGRGAFGSVVKARNKIDSRIYAVKKIRLRASQSDQKIFREVTALARLYHRYIVRYYTTWVETSENVSLAGSAVGSSAGTSIPDGHSDDDSTAGDMEMSDPFRIDLNELGSSSAEDRHSFPSIHFTRSATPELSESDPSDEDIFADEDGLFVSRMKVVKKAPTPVPTVSRTLYIQMEFVERQTLKERIAEGLSEEEAWRLFQQILDALVHMSSMNILHRDIKLTNIFIDGKGDCKIGDFGLATSSLAAVDPSDVSTNISADADMTLDVGTRLYIAPEVQSSKGRPRGQNHAKADMYSLGIVFFEMNYMFSTGSERIVVIEGLRKPGIVFPSGWDVPRSRQRKIITWLLQHDPDERPTALELSQSPLLPPKVEDAYYKDALRKMVEPDSVHRQSVLATLFSQTTKASRGFLYDSEELPEHATLNGIVHDRMVQIFRLHGAVDMEPPLLLPVVNPEDDGSHAMFLDCNGEVVALPNNALAPFARLAARINIRRIKRYHIGDVYRPDLVAGHPKATKTAVFDIITQDVLTGPSAAVAEAISVVNECIDSFANLDKYEIHLSHTTIYEAVFEQIPSELRPDVLKLLVQSDATRSQKRPLLTKKGLSRMVIDELEILTEMDEDIDALLIKLDKVSPQFSIKIADAIREIKSTVQFANATGVHRPIYFHPLFMMKDPVQHFNGICFEVVRGQQKRPDVLAVGGRYDHVINKFSPAKTKVEGSCAVAVQISLEKIAVALASFQSAALKTMLKERRSYGYWSPRRCDVYVVSHQEGADMMYEFGMLTVEHENVIEQCSREGILFIIYPRPRTARRDQPAFKVKSVLKGTEYEVSRQELVAFLHQQIAEQKRMDASMSGAPLVSESSHSFGAPKEVAGSVDVQLILPTDAKKQRKQTKQMFLDRAFEFGLELKNTASQSGIPTVAVDVPTTVFEEMIKNTGWVTDEDAWKAIATSFPPQHSAYAHQVREAIIKRKADGCKFLILFAVREERAFLLTLN
ncbi:hypothetical protein EW026_g1755 [Hermanssonia centrifuga]|uniref:non-specific serine/threonine protein kinase n=1 Tax=Hermanssonia centrifuga TaxID=98765 RepID=A0A4S4KQC7_9APHY|nr:hypothetical protein EW026_g1755 [Hermanssonia centrifuga]